MVGKNQLKSRDFDKAGELEKKENAGWTTDQKSMKLNKFKTRWHPGILIKELPISTRMNFNTIRKHHEWLDYRANTRRKNIRKYKNKRRNMTVEIFPCSDTAQGNTAKIEGRDRHQILLLLLSKFKKIIWLLLFLKLSKNVYLMSLEKMEVN